MLIYPHANLTTLVSSGADIRGLWIYGNMARSGWSLSTMNSPLFYRSIVLIRETRKAIGDVKHHEKCQTGNARNKVNHCTPFYQAETETRGIEATAHVIPENWSNEHEITPNKEGNPQIVLSSAKIYCGYFRYVLKEMFCGLSTCNHPKTTKDITSCPQRQAGFRSSSEFNWDDCPTIDRIELTFPSKNGGSIGHCGFNIREGQILVVIRFFAKTISLTRNEKRKQCYMLLVLK